MLIMDFHFRPEEFIVEEITSDGTVLEIDRKFEALAGIPNASGQDESKDSAKADAPTGDGETEDSPDGKASKPEKNEFSWFILQKRNWNTQQALDAISIKMYIPRKRFNFAGTKDRAAITTQLCSVFGVSAERMMTAHVKDVKINGAWPASEKIKLGILKGNRFQVTVNEENCGIKPDLGKISASAQKSNEVINYFGKQRFGSLRSNTHLVGYYILKANYKGAVENYLVFRDADAEDCKEEISETRREELQVRKKLEQDWDYKAALGYFPAWLKYEVSMIRHMADNPTDYIGAIRKIPRSIQLMFIHAAQADVFNCALMARIAAGKLKAPIEGDFFAPYDALGFPEDEKAVAVTKENTGEISEKIAKGEGALCASLVGCDTIIIDEFSQAELQKRGITKDMFSIHSMPELSSKGGVRPLWIKAVGLDVQKKMDESGATLPNNVTLKFSLPSGSYATVAVEQLISE
jgi:tRNA pseudouridine13 synthase